MEAMVKNDEENVWMTPLLGLRNELEDFSKERSRRDYRRMSGRVHLFHDSVVRGPYTKAARESRLRRVLEAQQKVRELGPPEFREMELISMAELQEIRRIWLYEKHEFDDSLPRLYEEVAGQPFPREAADDHLLGADDWQILLEVCEGAKVESQELRGENPKAADEGQDDAQALFELVTGLLDIERQFRGMWRQAGIYEALEDRLRSGQFAPEEEAVAIRQAAQRRRSVFPRVFRMIFRVRTRKVPPGKRALQWSGQGLDSQVAELDVLVVAFESDWPFRFL